MSSHARAYHALTTGKPMTPGDATQLLAALRTEYGDEFADALTTYAREQYVPRPSDSRGEDRRKRRAFGALSRAAGLVREFAASPFRATIPHQNDRSTS
ncbi:hypothetical protein ACPCAJ_21305 [Streptomyces griseoincarnatus]